ncbi:MAG: hypothetical protein ACRD5G_16340 [Candidatus Acidiferrales bacterium]
MSKQFGTIASIPRFVKAGTATLVALVLILAGTVVSDLRVGAQSAKRSNDTRRAFYLTPLTYDGSQAVNACVAGYHMASMWEIMDPSNLRYETTLGATEADAGSGPPITLGAWIRTGRFAQTVSTGNLPNCNVWTSNSTTDYGTVVGLTDEWSGTAGRPLISWEKTNITCVTHGRVWCVQN